jgi:hypothetical protein
MDSIERANFDSSTERAKEAMTWVRKHGGIVKDFKFRTGRWCWVPRITDHVYYGWNPTGGPALVVFHHVGYWLCFGWSSIEELPASDKRVLAFRKEQHNGGV